MGGNNHVALLTISESVDHANSTYDAVWCLSILQCVAGSGGSVFDNNGNNIAVLNTTEQDHHADYGDRAWTARFQPGPNNGVPEPGTLALLGTFGAMA